MTNVIHVNFIKKTITEGPQPMLFETQTKHIQEQIAYLEARIEEQPLNEELVYSLKHLKAMLVNSELTWDNRKKALPKYYMPLKVAR